MPELPEVETTRRGVAPHVVDRQIVRVDVREQRLRWPVPEALAELPGQRFCSVGRRSKYLKFHCTAGTLLVHLGMSGSLRLVAADAAPGKHAHVDIVFDNAIALRYIDPRRFGSMHWLPTGTGEHPLLAGLGPEPLDEALDLAHLYRASRGRRLAVKQFIMDSRVIAGVGNIYACEALFLAGIHPGRPSGTISAKRYRRLTEAVRDVLGKAVAAGGTTLRDFLGGDGRPGYFSQQLHVYGRGGEPCTKCSGSLRELRLGQRSTVFCPSCQT